MTRASDLAKLLGAGATINDGTTISTADNDAQLILKCTDTDASTGPKLELNRNPGEAGADGDNLGQIEFYGYNDASQKSQYAYLFAEAADVADGSEDVRFGLGGLVAGADTNLMTFTHGTSATGADPEMVFNDSSKDINFRVESDNDANAFFVEGSTGNIGIGTNSPAGDFHLTDASDIRILFTSDQTGNTSSDGSFIGLTDGGNLQLFNRENSSIIFTTNGTTAQTIRHDGGVTKPLQPYFSVGKTGTTNNISNSGYDDIVLDDETFDVGGNFASNVFTAPITGEYHFSINMRLDNVDTSAAYYNIQVNTSNRTHAQLFSRHGTDINYENFMMTVIADMDANDTAKIQIFQNGGTSEAK